MTRRLFRLAVSGLCLLSLLACIGTGWLWWRSYRVHDRLRHSTLEARYTLHSDHGRMVLTAPPAAGQEDAIYRQIASRLSNQDIVYSFRGSKFEGTLHDSGWVYGVSPNCEYKTASLEIQLRSKVLGSFVFNPSSLRPLLRALDDPQRVAAAHCALAYQVLIRGRGAPWISRPSEDHGGESIAWYDGLPVHFRPTEGWVRTYDRSGGRKDHYFWLDRPPTAWADTTTWEQISDLWHDRLDVTVRSVPHWQVMTAMGLPPLLWSGVHIRRAWIRRRRKHLGLCLSCGYDLRGSPDRCPECGRAVQGAS